MSLRARVIASMAAVLLTSIWLGALFAGYQARRSLHEELAAGLTGARQTVVSAFEDLPRSDHPDRDLKQLIAAFDGDRHVTAVLIDRTGRSVASSRTPERPAPAPGWFKAWLGAPPAAVELPVPRPVAGYRAIELRPVADLDIGAAWREFSGVVLILVLAIVLGLIAVSLVIKAALRPLEALSGEFVHVGAGDYRSRVAADGPAELQGLQRGFNAMVAQLAAMAERNRLLGDQLTTLQEEERVEIARDLHDEIGAHLFAVNMDAKMIAKTGEHDPAIVELAGSVQTAVGHMQRHVRDLLLRLRPTRVIELGLETALRDLIRHWSARRPEIAFQLRMDAGGEPRSDQVAEVIYRVVQEAVSNAVRHSEPTRIEVDVRPEDDDVRVEIDDDGRPLASDAAAGLGLIGMRERVAGCGGRLTFGPRKPGPGWQVAAQLPRALPTPRAASRHDRVPEAAL
jgi:two-component system, NarL family, sensor histidine kinase UhpB